MISPLSVFLFICLLSPFLVKSSNSTLNYDVLGLIVFKSDINDPHNKLSTWNEADVSPCNNKWAGVKCSSSNVVIELVLDNFGLSGKLGRGLLRLNSLQKLSLAKNHLTGSLSLNFSQLPYLSVLNLSENALSGSIPSNFFSQCGSLRSISLDNNMFSGQIPNSLSSCSSLTSLSLSGNQFSGAVPDGIGNCSLLKSIDLSRNKLYGEIPITMQKLSLCTDLVLSGNGFKSDLPEWIGEMRSLETLDLSHNSFSGKIPDSFSNLKSLKILNVSENNLTGNIPENIRLFKILNILDLSENQLNGSIPWEIGELSSLKSLYLAHNDITGPIPDSLANLSNLETVDFSFNKLSGTLPMQLSNLVHLNSFNISYNQLQGELPLSGFFSTIVPSSVYGNPLLCGAAVNNSCAIGKVLPDPIAIDPNSADPTNPNAINSPSFRRGERVLSVSSLIAICATIAIIIGVIFISVLNLSIRSSSVSCSVRSTAFSNGDDDDDDLSYSSTLSDESFGKLVMFSGNNPDFCYPGPHALLDRELELGQGGFGSVYRARLGDGLSVAIKKLKVSSLVKSQEDFEREVERLGKVRAHANVVSLDGYYWTPSLQLLVYEFVSGGNLYKHLHESGEKLNYLSWNKRFGIILGTAKGLSHLHEMNIIHYNLKSSNVMIDSSGEAKVTDYGLAQLLPTLDRYTKIQSDLGYMAPEFACRTVKITEKCDVYGFGALVLEIVTGKRPVEYSEDDVVVLCDVVRGALEEEVAEECVDGRLQGKFPVEEAIPVMKLGLMCTSQVPSNRPDMAEVVNMLELIRYPSEDSDELFDLLPDS